MRAISTFSREAGTSTFWCRACSALRTLVSISATGSVNLIVCFSSRHPFAPHFVENLQWLLRSLVVSRWSLANETTNDYLHYRSYRHRRYSLVLANDRRPTTHYQDDFATPGISPRNASPRKHKRHRPNLRK